MVDERTKPARCMLTPERHAAFKIACVELGITMDKAIHDAVRETIVRASLLPDGGGLAREEEGHDE